MQSRFNQPNTWAACTENDLAVRKTNSHRVEVNLGRQRRKVIPESQAMHRTTNSKLKKGIFSLVQFGLFSSFLQPHLEHIACPMNGFPVLIIYGGSRFHRLVANATDWRFGDELQDVGHWQPPKRIIGSHKRPGPEGHGGGMCKGTTYSLGSTGKRCCT